MAVHASPSTSGATRPRRVRTTAGRMARPARRLGYTLAALVNVVLLYLVNVNPGWEWFSFLTEDTTQVIGLVNASLWVGVAVNALWVLADPPWLRSAGQVVVSAVALAVLVQLQLVFPFDFSGWSFDPSGFVRFILVVATIGTVIGLLVEAVALVRVAVGQQDR